jgi:hypothetical protein
MIRLTLSGFDVDDRDGHLLRRFIESNVGNELSKMAQDCYYPRVAPLFKELMMRTNTNEKMLKEYSRRRYPQYKFKLLHDDYTTLLILITQYFINEKKDEIGARWTYNLFAIRYYSNIMHKYIKVGCNPDYWRYAMEHISHSHLFRTKKTVGNSVLYLSQQVYQRHHKDMVDDDAEGIMKMILYLRSRINQSSRSFFVHYYKASSEKKKLSTTSDDKEAYARETFEQNIKKFSDRISKDLCVYGKVNKKAATDAQRLTRFNKTLAVRYTQALNNVKYVEQVETIYMLMLRGLTAMDEVCTNKFLDHIKRLMAVKTSSKPVYTKKNLIELHDKGIIPDLELDDWFKNLSIQTKKVSRDYLIYYLAFFMRSYIC